MVFYLRLLRSFMFIIPDDFDWLCCLLLFSLVLKAWKDGYQTIFSCDFKKKAFKTSVIIIMQLLSNHLGMWFRGRNGWWVGGWTCSLWSFPIYDSNDLYFNSQEEKFQVLLHWWNNASSCNTIYKVFQLCILNIWDLKNWVQRLCSEMEDFHCNLSCCLVYLNKLGQMVLQFCIF